MEERENILTIEDFEDKKSQAGKRYTRFKTSQGWMSCFEKDVIEKLKDSEGKNVRVVVAVDKEKGFTNIRKFLGDGNVNPEKVRDEQPKISTDRNTSMYVAYVKDLVVAGKGLQDAINIVKQARDAF